MIPFIKVDDRCPPWKGGKRRFLKNSDALGSIVSATRLSDQQKFIVKALSESFMKPSEIKKFCHEFELGSQFNSPHIIKYLNFHNSSQFLATLFEVNNMISLEKAISENGFDIQQVLIIVIQMVQGLSEIHRMV